MTGNNDIKQRIRNGERIASIMLRFPSPASVEILAMCGIELIIIDCEHYPFNEETLIDLVRAADLHQIACVVRVPNAEPARISRIMDYGVDGILVPSVDTAEEAMQLVNAVKFSPIGNRGFCPISRAARYGMLMSPSEYASMSNKHSIVMVQIETKEGVENLDEILRIDEIDSVDYGPSDLAASYGIPGQNDSEAVREAVNTIVKKAKAAGKRVCHMAYTESQIEKFFAEKDNLICLGSDQQMLVKGLLESVRPLREQWGKARETDSIKNKLRNHTNFICMTLNSADRSIAEVSTLYGADLILIDTVHHPFNSESIIDIARSVQARGGECVVLLPNAESARVAQVMDYGIYGVAIPVEEPADVKQLLAAIKFSPVGKRGFCPITRAAAYGFSITPTQFAEQSNDQSLAVILIDTKKGLDNIAALVNGNAVDLVLIDYEMIVKNEESPARDDLEAINAAVIQAKKQIEAAGSAYCILKPQKMNYEDKCNSDRIVSIGTDHQLLSDQVAILMTAIKKLESQNDR